jgi:uncharacterized protein (DUF58 family)
MNSKSATIGLLIVGLLMAAIIFRNGNLALMALPFLTYFGAAIIGSPGRDRLRLSAERSLGAIPSAQGSTVEVNVSLMNAGLDVGPVRFFDTHQLGMKLSGGSLSEWTTLHPGETATLQYSFQAERGNFSWKALQVVVSDPFGLFDLCLELPASGEMQVKPRFNKLRAIQLRPDSTLHVPGSIPANLGGSGTDFWGIREYHPGDSLRRLDWRLAARHPGQLFTREFEQEEVADIGLILDARQGIDLRIGEDSLFEHSLSATASLAEMFLRQGHRVSLFILGDQMTMVHPGYSKAQLNRILRLLSKACPATTASGLTLDFIPLKVFPSSALLVLLSPLTPSDWSFFPRIRAHGNQGLLISPDPLDFAEPSFAQDPPGLLAIRAARVERRLKLRKIAHLHIRVIDWQVSQPLTPLVRTALRQTQIRNF